MASKWGSPEVIDTDLKGNISPKSMMALQRFAIENASADKEQAAADARSAAAHKRIDYWGRRGLASWQEPDYAGEDLAARDATSAALKLDTQRKSGDLAAEQAAQYGPDELRRQAEGEAYAGELEDKRYWSPRAQSRREQINADKLAYITAAPAVAGDNKLEAERIKAASALALKELGLSADMVEALAKATKSGMFGADKFGTGLAPGSTDPGAVQGPAQQGPLDALMKILNSGGQQDRTYNPDMEAQIKDAMVQTGESRQSVIEHFKAAGIIR